ncbi:MAG: DUF559 domain-containing protein, partial [Chloroflexota bacterium]
ERHGGRGCPFCTVYPRSMAEIVVACEIATVIPFDVNAHRVDVDGRVIDCDMVIADSRLVIEYDGYWFHRRKSWADRAKTERLRRAGWEVVRVRERPLRRLEPTDVIVRPRAGQKAIVDAVVGQLADLGYVNRATAEGYVRSADLVATRRSTRMIRRVQKDNPRAFVPPPLQSGL